MRTWSRGVTRGGRSSADRKSTRLNSSHLGISYAVFCLKKKKKNIRSTKWRTRMNANHLAILYPYCTVCDREMRRLARFSFAMQRSHVSNIQHHTFNLTH